MMRKLAVPVLAISLAMIGCGSDSTEKKDAAVKLDVAAPAPDGPKLDVAKDVAPTDVPAQLDAVPDAPAKLDVTGDVPATQPDARKDAGVDSSGGGDDGGDDDAA